MYRGITVITAAAENVMTLNEAKTHLRIDHSYDDDYISLLITVATQYIEEYTNRFLINTTIEQYSDTWEGSQYLINGPISTMVHIKYYDSNNDYTLWDATSYIFEKNYEPNRIGLTPDKSYPALADRIGAVVVKYVCGYGEDATYVPAPIIQAAKIIIGTYYENREETVIGRMASVVPNTTKRILDAYKIQILP